MQYWGCSCAICPVEGLLDCVTWYKHSYLSMLTTCSSIQELLHVKLRKEYKREEVHKFTLWVNSSTPGDNFARADMASLICNLYNRFYGNVNKASSADLCKGKLS